MVNSKEKFLNTLDFNLDTSIPEYEFGYWYDTLTRWYKEGLTKIKPPDKIIGEQFIYGEASAQPDYFSRAEGSSYGYDVNQYFNLDERIHSVAMNLLPIPEFEEETIMENKEDLIYRRYDGKTVKIKKAGTSFPQFLEFPVKSKKDLKKIFDKFDASDNRRLPPTKVWNNLLKKYKDRTFPLQLGGGSTFNGFFSVLRELMGLEVTLLSFYDNPYLIFEILDFFTDFYIKIFSKVASQVDVDYLFIWEDMAFNRGPLVSPEIFKKFIIKYYIRFINKMKECGVKHFFVDSDGNCEDLIPLFLKAGITGLLPFEVQAGMDIEKIRRKYPRLIILGGINKIALSKGRNNIIKELNKVKRVIKKGGYIPFTDHSVPPDVSFEDYCFFRKKLKMILKNKENLIC